MFLVLPSKQRYSDAVVRVTATINGLFSPLIVKSIWGRPNRWAFSTFPNSAGTS